MEIQYKQYIITDERARISAYAAHAMLRKTHWARSRSLSENMRAIENSHCFGVFEGDNQIGFARCVSDFATCYWLRDVVIDEAYRGRGIGAALVRAIVSHEKFEGLLGLLSTTFAVDFYTPFGFELSNTNYMIRKPTAE